MESSVPQLITLDPMDAMETMESILVDLMTIASPRWWRAGMVSWSYGLMGHLGDARGPSPRTLHYVTSTPTPILGAIG